MSCCHWMNSAIDWQKVPLLLTVTIYKCSAGCLLLIGAEEQNLSCLLSPWCPKHEHSETPLRSARISTWYKPRWLLNQEQVLGMQQPLVNLPKMLLKDSNFSITMFYWAACHAVFPPHWQKTIPLSPFCGEGNACKCCWAVSSRHLSSAYGYFIGGCQHYLCVPIWGRDLVETW